MELIGKIRQVGFNIALEGENIRLEYSGQGEPSEEAKALLDDLRERKVEAIAYLNGVMPKLFLAPDGGLVISFESDPRFHWWKGGQSVKETIEALGKQ